jgi:TonB-linked SusC/RagA family outer membrane protein
MKKLLLKLLVLFLTSAPAVAQTVTGRVSSSADGSALPGVSVLVKGTTTGTTTDTDGKYSINTGDPNATLVVSFIGFATKEELVNGRSTIDISLSEDIAQLGEVVVTALGVPRETKTLVYATQSVKPSTLTEVRDANNVLNSLQGKIANAQINQGSGGPGSGARIVLRGNRSINGSNNALIVVDGVPITNVTNSAATSDFGSVQSSDGASSINPDDIESVTVLRGASAAALYGSQAGNGVIIITTKKGGKEGVSFNVNSGVTMETPFALPRVQNSYGQGTGGALNTSVGDSWGAKMSGQAYTNNLGQAATYSAQPNNIKDFFRTGLSLNNSFNVAGGTEKAQTYLSYTNNKVQGIIPGNDMNRHTVNLRLSNQISKRFSTDAKVTYLNQQIDGRPRTGEENAPVIGIYQMPRSMSTATAKDYESINAVGIPTPTAWPSTLSSIYQNPYWLVNRTSINETRNRLIGFITAKYALTDWLSLSGRANLDKVLDQTNAQYSDGTILWANPGGGGFYGKANSTVTQRWYDLTLAGSNSITEDLKIDYRAGAIFQDTKQDQDVAQTNGLYVTNKFSLNFASNPSLSSASVRQQTQSVFGQFSIAYKEGLFLEGSIRNEWDSRLPKPYTIPYPSLGISGVISELTTLPNAISFLKASANYARVGNGGQAQARFNTFGFSQGAGNGFLQRSATEAIPNLKPEFVNNIEFGLDARFVEDRLGFTFTYYKSNATNQLLQLSQPVATGYSTKYVNVGNIQNSGIEIVMNATPVKNASFKWDMAFNLGMNRNKVISLSDDIKEAYPGGNSGYARTATPVVRTGGSYGDLYSKKWKTDDQGRYVVGANGLPVETDEQQRLGSFNPKALLGLTNTITYKRFSARILADGRAGGVILDGTEMNLAFSGISEVTANHREEAWSLGGVDDKGNAVNVPVTAQQFWSAGSNSTSGKRYGVGQFFAYDATNFRIREIAIGYDIPVPSSFFIKAARFSIVARNVMWLYRGSSLLDIPGIGKRKLQIDPDMSLGNGNFQGVQYGALPSTRSFGCNLKLTF